MSHEPDSGLTAGQLHLALGLLVWRLRETETDDLTLSETSALARLEQAGEATAAELARAERITPQSMGTTIAGLEAKGLVRRRRDPNDRRRAILSLTRAGAKALRDQREPDPLDALLRSQFTGPELRALAKAAPLIERLAHGL